MKAKWIVLLIIAAAGLVTGCATCCQAPDKSAAAASQKAAYYTCPMHPAVKSDLPGACHICGMDLVPVYTSAPAAKP